MTRIVKDVMVYCPFLKKEIAEGYCCEINHVVIGWLKPDAVEDKIDKKTAEQFCDKCENNQTWG